MTTEKEIEEKMRSQGSFSKKPEKYTVLIDFREEIITGWNGDILGNITWRGPEFLDNFGGSRINFRAKGRNNKEYYGTAYVSSSGDFIYGNMTKKKGTPRKKKGGILKDLI